MLRHWRRAGLLALAAGTVIAGQAGALIPAQAQITPTITINVTTKIKPVTGFHFVVFQAGTFSRAHVHGSITGATAGEVAKLYAQRFPFTQPAKPIRTVTLSVTGTASYSFAVAPALATHYWVKLFTDSTTTTPLATSVRRTVYVSGNVRASGGQRCARPVCRETFRLLFILPASAVKTEMGKHLYPYFGLRLGTTSIPPPPKWLRLNGGNARVTSARRVSATEFARKVKFSFTIGNHSFHWAWTACLKDTVTKDGLGIPGHHGCGNSRVLRTARYLG